MGEKQSYINYISSITSGKYCGYIMVHDVLMNSKEDTKVTLSVSLSSLSNIVGFTGHVWTYEYLITNNEIKKVSGKCTGGTVYARPECHIDILYDKRRTPLNELLKGAVNSVIRHIQSSTISTDIDVFTKEWCFEEDSCLFQVKNKISKKQES